MFEGDTHRRFERIVWPHMAAAYNLARWLARRDADAEDIVQEATVRALRFFASYHGGDARAWFLAIVRNTAYTWLRQNRSHELEADFETENDPTPDPSLGPEARALQSADHEFLRQALAELPLEFREALVLRELEGLSYREICDVTRLPMGTVMSRLSRARDRLCDIVKRRQQKGEVNREL